VARSLSKTIRKLFYKKLFIIVNVESILVIFSNRFRFLA